MKGKIKAFGKEMSESEYIELQKIKILNRINNVKPKTSKRQKRLLDR